MVFIHLRLAKRRNLVNCGQFCLQIYQHPFSTNVISVYHLCRFIQSWLISIHLREVSYIWEPNTLRIVASLHSCWKFCFQLTYCHSIYKLSPSFTINTRPAGILRDDCCRFPLNTSWSCQYWHASKISPFTKTYMIGSPFHKTSTDSNLVYYVTLSKFQTSIL